MGRVLLNPRPPSGDFTIGELVRDAPRLSPETDSAGPGDAVDELIGWLDVEPEDDLDSVIYQP